MWVKCSAIGWMWTASDKTETAVHNSLCTAVFPTERLAQARIALSPSIRFGLGGLLFLYILQPFFERVCSRLGPKITKRLAGIIVCIFLLDGLTVLAGL